MTDIIEDGPELEPEAPVVEAPEEAPPERQVDPETEALARKYGWRPKAESTLPDGSWMDADRFVSATKTRVRILSDDLAEAKRKAEAAEAIARSAADTVRRQERERFEQQLQSLKVAQRAAAEAGDVQRFDQLSEIEGRMQPPQPVPDPEAQAFVQSAAWAKDPYLFARAYELLERNPDQKAKPAIEQVRWADEQLRRYYPHMFPAAQPRDDGGRYTTSKVDGGGLATGRAPASSGLSAEERLAFEGLKARGVFKTEAEYVKYSKELGVRE